MPARRTSRRRLGVLLTGIALVVGLVPAPAAAGPPYSVTLSASATSVAVGTNITLVATGNQEITSPYGFVIVDDAGGTVVSCFGAFTVCDSFPLGWNENKTVTYTAKIVDNTNTDVLATSNSVTVTWGTGSAPAVTTTRIAGSDRYTTSALLSSSGFEPGVPVAYLATGQSFADALAGGAAAAAEGGPVLTTSRDSLPDSVATELARLRPALVVVLGGTAAVSEAVAQRAGAAAGAPVLRVAGADRYATAALISQRAFSPGVTAAFVATGASFADALAGGVAAAALGGPVLLVQRDAVPTATATELDRLNPATIYVLGSEGVVSAAVLSQLRSYAGSVVRYAGADRYTTAALVSAGTFPAGVDVLYLATGVSFADALAGVALAGHTASPMLLVQPTCIPRTVLDEIARLDPGEIVILGGTGAVSPAVASLTAC